MLFDNFALCFDISDTHFLQIISTLKKFLLLGWVYSVLLKGELGKFIKYFSLFLILFALIDYFYITGYKAPGVLMTIVGFFMVLWPMLYLWFLYHQHNRISIYKIPYFWFSIALIMAHILGLLFYFVGEKVYKIDFICKNFNSQKYHNYLKALRFCVWVLARKICTIFTKII